MTKNTVGPGGSSRAGVTCLCKDNDTFQQLDADLLPTVLIIDVQRHHCPVQRPFSLHARHIDVDNSLNYKPQQSTLHSFANTSTGTCYLQ